METTFFSVADKQLENLISFDDFEKSLYLNILFQGGILIPDNFIFGSSYIEKHIISCSGVSFFEAALEKGLIIPSFRNPLKVNFHDVLRELQVDSKPVQGIGSNANHIASRLQICANKGKSYKHKVWPQYSIGERFKDVLLNHLARKNIIVLPNDSRFDKDEIHGLWEQTTTWRNDILIDAISESSKIQTSGPNPGLRRGEIYNAVARRLGLDIPEKGVGDISFLLSAAVSKENFMLLSHFLGWVNECYHINLAESLESVPNSPKFIPPFGLMYVSLLPSGKESLEKPAFDVIEYVIKFPSLEMLRHIKGRDLVEIVDGCGQDYQAAIMDWERDPTSSNQQQVCESLNKYAKELNEFVLAKSDYIENVNLHTFFGSISSRDRITVENILKPLLSIVTPADIITKFAKGFVVMNRLDKTEPTSEKIRLISSQKSPEVNFPVSKEKDNS